MPPHIRAMLTLVVLALAAFVWFMREPINLNASPFLVFGLTAFMAGAIWLFPEVKKNAQRK